MIIKNMDQERGIVNGSRGVIIRFEPRPKQRTRAGIERFFVVQIASPDAADGSLCQLLTLYSQPGARCLTPSATTIR
jgi:hypothetical protein